MLFEYSIYKLMQWRTSILQDPDNENYFTRLVSLKLLFLLAAVKNMRDKDKDLLDIFDKFCAVETGPVETEIYSDIAFKRTNFYDFDHYRLITKIKPDFSHISVELARRIDGAVEMLKFYNQKLVTFGPFKLMDITRKWDGWSIPMGYAELNGENERDMHVSTIRTSKPYYE